MLLLVHSQAADQLNSRRKQEESLNAAKEAVFYLRDSFLRYPEAFVDRMTYMLRDYLQRPKAIDQEPGMQLLAPVLPHFPQLNPDSA